VGNLQGAEREDEHFPKRVADFLKEVRLPDQRPRINVCDRFDMVDRPHAPPLLEQQYAPPLHKALMKIYIDMNNRPEECLSTNIYYDSKVVGECCEKHDPQLSLLAYKRGMCDDELVDVTNRHGLYEQHACFLVERSTSGPKVLTEVEGETRPPPPCHRLGGADRAARDQKPRRRLDHGQGICRPTGATSSSNCTRRSYCRAAPS